MLGVKLICVGKMKERFYTDAFGEYEKRLGRYCRFQCLELPEERLLEFLSDKEIAAALAKEAAAIERNIPKDAYVTAMCVEGKQMSSRDFADVFSAAALSGRSNMCFIIGSSFGLDDSVKKSADARMSMSEMTFPHHLARVMLAEQIYRAFQIIGGTRYHK